MSIEWLEGFEWLANGETSTALEDYFSERYESANMDAGTNKGEILNTQPGPNHTLHFGDATGDNLVIKTPSNPQEVYLSMRVLMEAPPTSGDLIQFRSDASNLEIVDLDIGPNGEWSVNRLLSTPVARFHPLDFQFGEWCTIEYYVKVDNSTGAWEIKVNGTSYASESGVDTQPITASAHVDDIVINNVISGNDQGIKIRDLIIYNGDGSVNNSWVGEQRHVYTLLPDADGDSEDWTLSAGTDSYALLDDVSHDGDTTYIESSTAAEKTLVNLSATGSESNIAGVSIHTTARLDSAGSETFKQKVKEGGTEGDGANQTVDSTSYAQFEDVWEENPDTAAAWSAAELDGAQAGVEYV